ncbi:sodium-dependent bicarbonate transport family permease [Mycobacterium botniense]|uniref:Sodium-dependent bicarbonate transport family permease n=1 Tax=Mycobacterium botniense TaxID=84962 RepID=A0A7I9XZY9_9MYCO|nr:sodium-dependent bicarbonate transport family permease [Mycobacterium botniense]
MYLLLAIGWHGGEELATIHASSIGTVAGFLAVGFALNSVIGFLAYVLLTRMTSMRRIDRATVAGYYGSDSAGTFATCVGVLASVGMAFNGFMPVMLALMEIPGCLVALSLAARLRHKGMDPAGNMPGEPGYLRPAPVRIGPGAATQPAQGDRRTIEREREPHPGAAMSPDEREHPGDRVDADDPRPIRSATLLREVVLNPGLYRLFGGIAIGLVSRLQGPRVVHDDDSVFVTAFQGALCLFLLEMGMTASRKLKDLKTAGPGFIVFGLLAPNLFATLGIITAHIYAYLTHADFMPGTYILFAVLCGAASYIAVPAVQRLAIPEASPTLPLAASLGLTFSYNVTIGIPLYIEIARFVGSWFI